MAREKQISGISPCINCGHMVRPWRMTIHEAPGTRLRVGGGLCRECAKKRTTLGLPPGASAEAIARHDAANREALEGYMRQRAARIARNQRMVRS